MVHLTDVLHEELLLEGRDNTTKEGGAGSNEHDIIHIQEQVDSLGLSTVDEQ